MSDSLTPLLFERADRVLLKESERESKSSPVQRLKRAISNSSSIADDLTLKFRHSGIQEKIVDDIVNLILASDACDRLATLETCKLCMEHVNGTLENTVSKLEAGFHFNHIHIKLTKLQKRIEVLLLTCKQKHKKVQGRWGKIRMGNGTLQESLETDPEKLKLKSDLKVRIDKFRRAIGGDMKFAHMATKLIIGAASNDHLKLVQNTSDCLAKMRETRQFQRVKNNIRSLEDRLNVQRLICEKEVEAADDFDDDDEMMPVYKENIILRHAKYLLRTFRGMDSVPRAFVHVGIRTALERMFGIDQVAELDVELEHIIFNTRKMTLVGADLNKEDASAILEEVKEEKRRRRESIQKIEGALEGLTSALCEGEETKISSAIERLTVIAESNADIEEKNSVLRRRLKRGISVEKREKHDRIRRVSHAKMSTIDELTNHHTKPDDDYDEEEKDMLSSAVMPDQIPEISSVKQVERHRRLSQEIASSFSTLNEACQDLRAEMMFDATRDEEEEEILMTTSRPSLEGEEGRIRVSQPIRMTRPPARSRVDTNVSLLDDDSFDLPPTPGVSLPSTASKRTQKQNAISKLVTSCIRLRRLSASVKTIKKSNKKDRMWSLVKVVAKKLLLKSPKFSNEEEPWWISHYKQIPKNLEHSSKITSIPDKKKKKQQKACTKQNVVSSSAPSPPKKNIVVKRDVQRKVVVVPKFEDISSRDKEEEQERSTTTTTRKQSSSSSPKKQKENVIISQLWDIFSHYALKRYPDKVDHMSDAMGLEFLRDCKFLRNKSSGKKHETGLTAAQARVLFRSVRTSRMENSFYESVIRHKNSTSGSDIMFLDFLRLIGCLATSCIYCARPCAHCCAAKTHNNMTDQILLHAFMVMEQSSNVDTIYDADIEVHEQFQRVVKFVQRYVFSKAQSRSRPSCVLGNNTTETGRILEDFKGTLPIVLQAALVPTFNRFCKIKNSFFSVLHTGGYYLSAKDSSNIQTKRNMFWPQFLAFCEHVKIVPALHVRDVAEAFLSASKKNYHKTKKNRKSGMCQVFVTHELSYNSFLLALYHVGLVLRLRDDGMMGSSVRTTTTSELLQNNSKYIQKLPMHSRMSLLFDVLMTNATTDLGSAAFKFTNSNMSIGRQTEIVGHVVSKARSRSLYFA